MFFAAALHVVLVRFSVHFDDHGTGRDEGPLECVRRAVWGTLYAGDAGIVSKSAEGLAETMTIIVTVSKAAGLTVSEQNSETMLL